MASSEATRPDPAKVRDIGDVLAGYFTQHDGLTDVTRTETEIRRHCAAIGLPDIRPEEGVCHLLHLIVGYALAYELPLDRIAAVAGRIDPFLLQGHRWSAREHDDDTETRHLGPDSDLIQDLRSKGAIDMLLTVKAYCEISDIEFAETLANVRAGRLTPAFQTAATKP